MLRGAIPRHPDAAIAGLFHISKQGRLASLSLRADPGRYEIVASIKGGDVINQIASASAEQATGSEQVNKALTQMDEVTQQNSALVEENAATARILDEQAKLMDGRVACFHVGGAELGNADAVQVRPAAIDAA